MSTPEQTSLDTLSDDLAGWLPTQRWFGGKDRRVTGVQVGDVHRLVDGDPALLHAVVTVLQGEEREHYQLLLGVAADPEDYLRGDAIAQRDGLWFYDGTLDAELVGTLLGRFGAGGSPEFTLEPGVSLKAGLRGRPVGAEQSNTSVVFGQRYVLKLFRRLSAGENRDLRLHRALHGAGCTHIATPLGAVTGVLDGRPTTFGLLQEFLPDAVDGWLVATASVRDLMAEADLHADEVGGDFAGEAYRLGQAVAAVHADLARALPTAEVDDALMKSTVDGMHRRLDLVLATMPALGRYEAAVRAVFDAAREAAAVPPVQFVHGDLHLGQTLRGNTGWLLIDFEGEPVAALSGQAELESPLSDVAGMIRSFDYAAHQHLLGYPADHQHAVRATEWAGRNAESFCDGYADAGADPRAHQALLRALVLHKAVYEVGYEHANRPDWLDIPLGAIARLVG